MTWLLSFCPNSKFLSLNLVFTYILSTLATIRENELRNGFSLADHSLMLLRTGMVPEGERKLKKSPKQNQNIAESLFGGWLYRGLSSVWVRISLSLFPPCQPNSLFIISSNFSELCLESSNGILFRKIRLFSVGAWCPLTVKPEQTSWSSTCASVCWTIFYISFLGVLLSHLSASLELTVPNLQHVDRNCLTHLAP